MVSQRYLCPITTSISTEKKVPKVVPFTPFVEFLGTFCETRSLKFDKNNLAKFDKNFAGHVNILSYKQFVTNLSLKNFLGPAEIFAPLWA